MVYRRCLTLPHFLQYSRVYRVLDFGCAAWPTAQRLRGQINYIPSACNPCNIGKMPLLVCCILSTYINLVPQIVCESVFGVFICFCKGSEAYCLVSSSIKSKQEKQVSHITSLWEVESRNRSREEIFQPIQHIKLSMLPLN
jgi:hypothetical protein